MITETISNQIYNNKRQLLEYAKVTDIFKLGENETGKKIEYKETITSSNLYEYDNFGRMSYSKETSNSSQRPLITTVTITNKISYDERNRKSGYTTETQETSKDLSYEFLNTLNRSDIKYDAFDRTLAYKEERSSSDKTQKQFINRNNISYDKNDMVKGFKEETTFENSSYTKMVIEDGILYDKYGNEKSFRKIISEKDTKINAENLILQTRLKTVMDAFGNMVFSLDRTMALSPSSNFVSSSFFTEGALPEASISQIVFEGGRYDEFGRYVGFRET
ncbi:MAG: hypothetical protein ACD_79C01147G0001, partial [uncultured bacterium]